MLLTDSLLLDFKRCPRRAYLNLHGDYNQRNPERDFLLKLRQENQQHAAEILEKFYPHHQIPQTPPEEREARVAETIALMSEGVDCIYQGMLWTTVTFSEQNHPFEFAGTPHLLIRQPGLSRWGDWLYVPASIHLGRRPKPEYKLVAAFYAQLLSAIQSVLPPIVYLFLRRRNHYVLDLAEWLPRLNQVLADCATQLMQQQEPEVFISRQRCSLCHWHRHCYELAQSQQHLSLVPGVTPTRYQSLQNIGVASIESLAGACPKHLGEVIGRDVASQLQQQAQSILENRAMLRLTHQSHPLPQIPTATIELYFDIEAEPERNLDYLLGVLVVNHQDNTQEFNGFLAIDPENEEEIWQEFLKFIKQYKQAPIFHFSEYEVETIKRLAKCYQTPHRQIMPLLSRCIDLHRHVVHSVTLPVESYSLKSLAQWLGFQWREVGAGGDQCVCWYDQWLKTGERHFLEMILRYNEDDCRATFHLKHWLTAFLSPAKADQ